METKRPVDTGTRHNIMSDSLFSQKGPGQVPRGQEQSAVDANPSPQPARIGTPVWKSFVSNKEFQENNAAAIQAEQQQIRQARRQTAEASQPIFRGAAGKLIRKVGRQVEELNPEEWADDPVAGPEARKSLWDNEIRTLKKQASDDAFQLRDPSFHAKSLSDKRREDMLAEGGVLQESDPRHAELKARLAADDEYRATKTTLAQRAFDAEKRARELESVNPDDWWQTRNQPKPSEQRAAVVAQAQAERADAAAADNDAATRAREIDAELQSGVTGERSKQLLEEKAEIAAGRGKIAEVAAKAEEPIKAAQEEARGFLGNEIAALKRGYAGAAQAANILQGATDATNAADIARYEAMKEANPQSKEFAEFMKAEGFWESAKAFAKNPVQIVAEVMLESAAQMVPSLALGAAGGAAGGALASAPTAGGAAPATVPLGAVIGSAVGAGSGSFLVEYGSSMIEAMQEAGMDAKSPKSIQQFFADPAKLEKARGFAAKRGIAVGVFDAVSYGLAGKFLKPVQALAKSGQKVGTGAVLAATGKEIGAQALAGGTGEAAGQLASRGEIQDGKSIFLEGIAEVASAPVEVATNLREFSGSGVVDPVETVAAELATIDPEAAPPAPEEVAAAEMIAPKAVADGVLIERELAEIEAEDKASYDAADAAVAEAVATGDTKAVKAAEEARDNLPLRAPKIRAVLKIAAGKQLDDLTAAELSSIGAKADKTGFEPMTAKELKEAGLARPLIRDGADGSLILTDEALKAVESISPRARSLVKMSEAEALAKAKERTMSEWDVPMRDGSLQRVRANSPEMAEREAAGMFDAGTNAVVPGGATQVQPQATNEEISTPQGSPAPVAEELPAVDGNGAPIELNPVADGVAPAAEPDPGAIGGGQPGVAESPAVLAPVGNPPAATTDALADIEAADTAATAAKIDDLNSKGLVVQAIREADKLEKRRKERAAAAAPTDKESLTVAPTLPAPSPQDWKSRDKFVGEDFAGPANSVVIQPRDADSNPVGDPITLPLQDSMEATADMVASGFTQAIGGGSWRESLVKVIGPDGKAIAQMRYNADTGKMEVAEQSKLDAARETLKQKQAAPAPTPNPKETRSNLGETRARIRVNATLAKLKKNKRINIKETTGATRAVPGEIQVNPDAIIKTALERGMNDEQAGQYFDMVLDEEIRHLAQFDAAETLWKLAGSPGKLKDWREAHYTAIWQNDFVATGKDKDVEAAYGKSETGVRADWKAMDDWQKAMEGIRIMSQTTPTENAKLWTDISEGLKQAIRAALASLKKFRTPALETEITNLENALRQLTDSSPDSKKPAPGKTGAGDRKPTKARGDSQPSGDGEAVPARRDGAGSPVVVGSRVEFERDGRKLTGIVTLKTDAAVRVRPDENPAMSFGVPIGEVRSIDIQGPKINKEWTAFAPESGTLGIPRALMPQIKSGDRSALVQFLKARGVDYADETVPASSLKPTQTEYSPAKVAKAKAFEGGNRSILISSDNHVLDGHHQWLAARDKGEDIAVIRLDSPIRELLPMAMTMPSVTVDGGKILEVPDQQPVSPEAKSAAPNGQSEPKVAGEIEFEVQSLRPGAPRETIKVPAKPQTIGRGSLVAWTDQKGIERQGRVEYVVERGEIIPGVITKPTKFYSVDSNGVSFDVSEKNETLRMIENLGAPTSGVKPPTLTPAEEQAKKDLFDAFEGLATSPLEETYRSRPPADRLPAFQKAAQSLIAAGVETPESLAAFIEKVAPGRFRPYSEFLWRQVNSFLMGDDVKADWAEIYGRLGQNAANESGLPVDAGDSGAGVGGVAALGTTGKAIWQGWKALTGPKVASRTVIEARDVNNGGIYGWVNGELMRLQKTKSGRNTIATMAPATKDEIDGLHESIDRGALQIESRRISGAGGEWSSEDAGALIEVIHQATGQPLQEFLDTPEGKAWQKRMDDAVAKATGVIEAAPEEAPKKDGKPRTKAAAPTTESITAPAVETPVEAAAEVKGEMVNPANRRPAKEIKAEIIKRVEEEIAKLPEINAAFSQPKTKGGKRVLNGRIANIDTVFSIEESGSGWNIHAGLTASPKNLVTTVYGNIADLQRKAPYHMMLHVTGKKPESITFSIPGDGTFKLIKDRGTLQEFLGRVKSMPITTGNQTPKSKPFRAWYENGNLHISLAGIESAQDPELRKKLVEKFGETAVRSGEDVALARVGVTREELNGEAPAPSTVEISLEEAASEAKRDAFRPGPEAQAILDGRESPDEIAREERRNAPLDPDAFGGANAPLVETPTTTPAKNSIEKQGAEWIVSSDKTDDTVTITKSIRDGFVAQSSGSAASSPGIDFNTAVAWADNYLKAAGKQKPKKDPKPSDRIEDFGEKILGARKDLWGKFKTAIEQDLPTDVADMAISKSLPEPDYETAIAQGISVDALAAYKAIRDSIPSKPRVSYKLDRWATMFRGIHPLMQKLATGAELTGPEVETAGKLLRTSFRSLGDKINFYRDLGFPAFQKADDWRIVDGVSVFFENGVKLEKPVTKTIAYNKGRFTDIESRDNDRKGYIEVLDKIRARIISEMEKPADTKAKSIDFNIYSDRLTKDVFIGKKAVNGVIRLKTGFKTGKEASQYLADNQAQLEEQWKGMGAKPDYRRQVNAPRQGPTRREGDATPEQFQEAFGFRGVQFGNWVEGDRRQVDINEAFDAFMDLAEALQIPPRAVSLDGSLGLAFGARGRAGAAAHYESGEVVINLTKMAGPGSLAHEWFHAFDNYFARLDKTGETKAKPMDAFATTGTGAPKNMRPEVWQAFKNIRTVLATGPFAERSKKLDDTKSKPYYQTTIEKAARAFERYTVEKLEGKEISNDYLVNIVKDFDPALPTEEEMGAGIREAFDGLFNVIETVDTERGVSLATSPLTEENTTFKRRIKVDPELTKNSKEQQTLFGKNVASGKLAGFGGKNSRLEQDIVDAEYEFRKVVKTNADAARAARARLKENAEEIENKLLRMALGEDVQSDAADQLAFQYLINDKSARAGNDKAKHAENAKLRMAYRLQRGDIARELQIGYDRSMSPDERAQAALTELIYTPSRKVQEYAKKLTGQKRLDYLAAESAKRLAEVEAQLKKMGTTLAQVTGQNQKLQLENTRLGKELLKTRNVMEADIIKAVRNGWTMSDIKKRWGPLGAEQAMPIITKARQELYDRISEMSKSGMTRDQILEKIKEGLATSPLGASNGMTPDEIWNMIENDLGIPAAIPTTRPTTSKPKPQKAPNVNPLTSDWSRPDFTDGLKSYTFDTKDREGIMERVEIIRGLAGAVGKIDALKGDKQKEAIRKLQEINAILKKYGTDATEIFNSSQSIEDYRFDLNDIAQVAAVSRAISMIDADIVDKASEWLYFSMLSGLQTMLVNATAIVPAAWESTVGKGVEMAINSLVRNPMGAQIGEERYVLRAIGPALTRALSNARTSFAAQHPMFDRDVMAQEVDWERIMGGKGYRVGGSISGKLGDRVRIPMRILAATDDFNTTLMAMCEVGAYAYRVGVSKGMKPGSAELDKFIRQEVNTPGSFSYQLAAVRAKNAIFSNPLPGQQDPVTGKKVPVNDLGDAVGYVAGKITETFAKEHDNLFVKSFFAAMRISFFPFQRTPFNILRKGIRYTLNPFSLLDIALGVARNARNDGKWDWKITGDDAIAMERRMERANLVTRLGMQLQGGMLMLLVAGLGEGDEDDQDKPVVITGSSPFTPRGMAERMTAMDSGVGPYRISFRRADGSERFGFNYGRIEPMATTLAASIDIMKQIKRADRSGKDTAGMAGAALGGFVAQAQDKSFLRGVGDLISLATNAIAEPDLKDNRKMQQFVAGRVAMAMPNIIKQPIREMDSNFRERSEGFMQELLYQTIPAGQKPARVDAFGQTVEKVGTPAARIIDIGDTGTTKVNPVASMLLRYRDKHPDKAWFPSAIRNATYKHPRTGKEVEMTAEQLAEFRTLAGRRAAALLKSMKLNTENPTERDIEMVRKAFTDSRSAVKKALVAKYSR